jgi:hypothetical protein
MSWFSDWFASKKPKPPEVKKLSGWCVPSAIFCAMAWMIKNGPVRMAMQHLEPGVDHVQAQAKINEVWTPLTEIWDGTSMAVQTWTRHFPVEPYRYLTLKEFFDEQYAMFKKE